MSDTWVSFSYALGLLGIYVANSMPTSLASTINETLEALLVGGLVTAALYGVTCLQCFIFFQRFSKEGAVLKNAVWLIWVLDSVHVVVFVGYTMHWYMVKNFANSFALFDVVWSIPAGIVISTVSDTVVRCCFIYRLWILSERRLWVVIPGAILSTVLFSVGLASGIRAFALTNIVTFGEINWLLDFGFGLIVSTDFYIAASLWYFLYRARKHFNHRTYSLLNTLMVYTINTGVITSIVSLVCIVLFATMPHNYIFVAMYFPLEKLYVNALLASLNARDWFLPDADLESSQRSGAALRDVESLQHNTVTSDMSRPRVRDLCTKVIIA